MKRGAKYREAPRSNQISPAVKYEIKRSPIGGETLSEAMVFDFRSGRWRWRSGGRLIDSSAEEARSSGLEIELDIARRAVARSTISRRIAR